MATCDICGERRKCRLYRCTVGKDTDYMFLCDECVKIQKKEGPVVDEDPSPFDY